MLRQSRWFAVVVFMANVLAAQEPPAFEVVSIKRDPAPKVPLPYVSWLAGERMTASGITLAQLIRSAYVSDGIQLLSQVIGGDKWVSVDQFDLVGKLSNISATTPDDANRQRQYALKALLADRFKLRSHLDKRELPIFELVTVDKAGKLGPQIKASTCTRVSNRPCVPFRMSGVSPDKDAMTMVTEGVSMSEFAAAIVSFPEILRPIRDRTGLTGTFDLTLTLSYPKNATTDTGILSALPEQLGLKLEPRRAVVDVLVIDSVQPPTED
jgi:uncharacterized protein (TIGR03435 family)